ncbi:MAG: phosphoribosylamine--glycine ligase [Coriobacteriia bacterium]|nr:phosphoribosylamine--glycine ligase [Coriobacteriia bacterium]
MNVMLLGSGGREHALAWALAKSPQMDKLYIAPGNGGTAAVGENVAGLDANNGAAVLAFAQEHSVDLVVIGPEAPLVAGVADGLRAAGIAVFGPSAQGAQLEGSKDFSKQFMDRHSIPTAAYATFEACEPALEYVRDQGAPIVIKADGLAAGKGVVVAETLQQAEDAVCACFEGAFGEAGNRVVVEECMTGPECSLLAFVTAGRAFCMTTAQDHKRAYDGDKGPNTGGMGVYSPVPIVTEEELAAMTAIMETAAAATASEFDMDYRGCLYGGFMLTPAGPKIVEFNARFGDPETQVVLPRLKSDLLQVMLACAEGRADDVSLEWDDASWAVSVVLASAGYPGSYEKGKVITGIEDAEALDGVTVFHAGTKVDEAGSLLTNGGRVLNVTALGPTFEAARDQAYAACQRIDFEGKQFRTDIGAKALRGRSAWD